MNSKTNATYASVEYPKPQYCAWTFPLTVAPMGAVRQVHSDKWNKRTKVIAYRAYCDELRLQAALNHFTLMDDMGFEFHFAMAPSWSVKKKSQMNGEPHKQKPDLDNLIKALWDALCKDDEKISSICGARKVWGLENKIVIYKEI